MILLTDQFRECIKSFMQKILVLFLCVDEWTDKIKRNLLGGTVHGAASKQPKKCLIYFKRVNPAKVSGSFLQDTQLQLMKYYNIENYFQRLISDNAANMIVAFDNEMFKMKCCIIHTLNLII